jgi:hypothetical protein
LTFCDILGHFHAVVLSALSQKSSAAGENRSTHTSPTADLEDAIPALAPDRRQDAARFLNPPSGM